MPHFDRLALCLALAAAPVRILIATASTLTPDEAYYASAARLGTTVPDHPPLVVIASSLGLLLPDALSLELRLRIVPLILGTIVSLLILDRVRRESESATAQRWAALIGAWLLLPMAGGFLATPDVAVFLAALILLETESSAEDHRWTAVMVFLATALGMLSKVVMAPVVLAVIATTGHGWRRRIVLITALLVSLPFARDSLVFQLAHAYGTSPGPRVGAVAALGAAVLAQAALWTPVVLFLGARSIRTLPRAHVAVAGSLTALFLLSAAVRGIPPEPNWLAPAMAAVLPAAAVRLASAGRLVRTSFLLLGPAVTLIAVTHVLRPWLPLSPERDPSARLRGACEPGALGVGPYAQAAMRCAREGVCEDIAKHIQDVRRHLESVP